VSAGRPERPGDPLNHPIVLASSFRAGPEYARTHGTATWSGLEEAVGVLEGGRAVAYATGMAAASALLFALAPRTLVLPTVSYLGVRALAHDLAERDRLAVVPVDVTDTDAVLAAAGAHDPGTTLAWVESPANPTLDEADLPALCRGLAGLGVPCVVDSTFATPLGQQPLALGATAVLHSGTKLIGGHSDLMIGLAVTADEVLHDRLVHARVVQGATPGALESFLALRGLRTLPLRYEAACRTAVELAARLGDHPAVASVRHAGAMVSVVVRGGAPAADAVCERVRLLVPATSLGGVETTIERRQKYPGDAHVDPGLLRISVGIEDVEDLWADLAGALAPLA
jgi:cystathionine gamma-synthase